MTHHKLKSQEPFFEAVLSGDKTFEIRYDDRGFQKGDTVELREYDDTFPRHRECFLEITYISTFQQPPNWIVFGFKKLSRKRSTELARLYD